MMAKKLIDKDEDVVLVFAVVPAKYYNDMRMNVPCHVGVIPVGKFDLLAHKMPCAHLALTVGKSIQQIALKEFPELGKKDIVHPLDV